jgi:hypothetical protein
VHLLVVHSLAEQAQALVALVREAANAHAEAAAVWEDLLQDKVESVQEVKRMKEALARQAE